LEDASRKRKGNAAQNYSVLLKIALNLLKNEKNEKQGVKGKSRLGRRLFKESHEFKSMSLPCFGNGMCGIISIFIVSLSSTVHIMGCF